MVRLKYSGLPEDKHTFTYDEKPDGHGGYQITGQPQINRNDVVEVEDLNDPKSERARMCRGHVDGGLAVAIEEKPKKGAPGAAARSAEVTEK